MKNMNFRDDRVVDFFHEHFEDQADRAMSEAAVLDLVRRHEIAAMTGAELLGMHLTEFADLMAARGVPFFTELQSPEESLARWKAGRQTSES